jgi:hypothetical protein
MAIPALPGTRIQGLYYDFTSVEITVGKMGVCPNLTDINYSQKLDPGIFRGSGAKIIGRTRGTYDASGSFTIYKEDYETLKATLLVESRGKGYMLASFGIVVVYREADQAPIVDKLKGCRIVGEDNSLSSGNNTTVVKVDLSVMEVIANFMPAVTSSPGSKGLSNAGV